MALHEYKCHKVVKAAMIVNIWMVSGGYKLKDEDGDEHFVTYHWFDKFEPEVGDYLVEYEDGYQSRSPAGPFEAGYTKVN